MLRAYKYRAYPTREQAAAMATMVETHRHLYNRALAERKDAWEQEQRPVCYGDQSATLKAQRLTNPYLGNTNFSSCQATLRRLDRAFQAFFRRLKAGETPGYPRFRGRGRYDTVVFPSYGDGCKLRDGRAYFQHVGVVKVKLHRPVEGRIKTMAFRREADGWYVVCSCDLGNVAVEASTNPAVGIDLGLKAFLTTSEGESVPPPKFYRAAQRKLRRAQRHLSRCQKGSQRRQKARERVAKLHQHIGNQRRDWHHKTALALTRCYGVIGHEVLNIRGIARTRLAKSTLDAGWRQFLGILARKGEETGVSVVAVDARNTTQACSACGSLPAVPLTLRDREYHCASCGYRADRDLNAALNVRTRLGWSRQAQTGALAPVA